MLKETAERWIICAFNSISVSLPPCGCAEKKMLIWLRATDSRRDDHTSVLKTSTQSYLIITSCTMDGKFPFFIRVRAQQKPADRTRQVATWEKNRKKRTGGVFAEMAGNNSHNDNNNTQRTTCCWSWRKALFYFLLFFFSFIFSLRRRGSKHNRESPLYKETGGKFWTREKKREKNNGIVCCGLSVHKTNRRVISSRSSAFI